MNPSCGNYEIMRYQKRYLANVAAESISHLYEIIIWAWAGQYLSDFDDFGVVEKPWVPAFQRHRNHQNPLSADPVQGHVMI